MKACIVGAGAIGGMLGVELALAGHEVTFICRGANLEAARKDGIILDREDGTRRHAFPVNATDRLAEAGVHDVIVLAMKAHQVAPVAAELNTLLGPDSVIVTMQNGIPWWYFSKLPGPHENRRIEAVDPGGVIAAHIDVERVIGCIVYPAAELVAPGHIRQVEGNRLSLGELDGSVTPRLERVAQLFREAGFKAPLLKDIRSEIWLKLWGNVSFNPISALCQATLVDICEFPLSRQLVASMMAEAQTIGQKLGAEFRVSMERRIEGARGVGKHKTSMLQDVEQGRPLEIDAMVGAVVELGRITETPTPHIDAVYACASLLAARLRQERGRLRIEKHDSTC
jgi:2-dehydropantoate 2-reductase